MTPGLVSEFGWPSAFYSFGAIALLWAPFWFALPGHRETRGDDDEIEDAETRRFIAESSAAETKPPASFAIWTELIRRKEVRAICVAQFTQSWGMYGLLSWLPTYFNEAQGVDLADLPAFTFAPYILQGVLGFGVGIVADDLIHNKNVRVKTVRRAAQCAGTLGPALCLLVAASPLAEGNATLAAVAVDLGLALSALTLAGVSVSHLDIAPRHAGMVFATGNTAATLAGALAVPVSGAILDASDSWSLVFAVIAFVYVSRRYLLVRQPRRSRVDVGRGRPRRAIAVADSRSIVVSEPNAQLLPHNHARMPDPIPCARAREQRERSKDVCDDITNAVRRPRALERATRRARRFENFKFVVVPLATRNARRDARMRTDDAT